jgi:hypothetical protein
MSYEVGDLVTADALNASGFRRVGTTTATSNASTTSGTTELAVDQVTATLVSGSTYRLKWYFKWTATVANDRFALRVRDGSGIGGTERESLVFNTLTGNVFTEMLERDYTAGSSGSQTWTGTVARISGTGTVTPDGNGTGVRSFTVERVD